MTHDEIIERAAQSKSIDFSGTCFYYSGYGEDFPSVGLSLKPPMGEIVWLELIDLFEALDGKSIRLQITVVE